MSETPKFEVIDRRKMKAEEEQENQQSGEKTTEPVAATPSAPPEPGAGPRLVVNEGRREAAETERSAAAGEEEPQLPPAPTAAESHEQKVAYEASSQRLEELIRAQNPAVGAQPPVNFENLVQQFYVSAMIQMGAGTQEGQRPRVDILGARTTIDLLGVLAEKTKGKLTSMINLQAMQPPAPPPPGKK